MDERPTQAPAVEIRPPQRPDGDARAGAGAGRPLDDGRALTILTTEHWSLLSARGLVYNEAFARAGMFLSFLSATLVALGLVSTGTGFSREFLAVVAGVFALDLFIGVATLGRIAAASAEDIRYLQGMNRLRHAYHETVPGLERYFISSAHDDVRGVLAVYGADPVLRTTSRPTLLHGFTTVPGMIGVIVAGLLAALTADLLLLIEAGTELVLVAALVAFVAGIAASLFYMVRVVRATAGSIRPIFPTPGVDDPGEG